MPNCSSYNHLTIQQFSNSLLIVHKIEVQIPYSPLQALHSEFLDANKISLWVKRDDLIHPQVSGNKWRKLKYNLIEAKSMGYKTILSFGGAFSNHIYSLAAAGKMFGLNTIGIIRGEEHQPLNPTLSFAENCGMKLIYLDRESYRRKEDPDFLKKLQEELPPFFYVPEGGSNLQGVKGCEEIIPEIETSFDFICTACGTGGTISGLINSCQPEQKVLGFCVLKGEGMLDDTVKKLTGTVGEPTNWEINYSYHCGGYARITPDLIAFMDNFEMTYGIQLEPVYTGKMFYGLFDLIQKGYFPKGSRLIALHTGGLQGIDGMNKLIEKMRSNGSGEK